MRFARLGVLLCLTAGVVCGAPPDHDASSPQLAPARATPVDPEAVFRSPDETAKPGVWWHWMGSNVSKEGITRDL